MDPWLFASALRLRSWEGSCVQIQECLAQGGPSSTQSRGLQTLGSSYCPSSFFLKRFILNCTGGRLCKLSFVLVLSHKNLGCLLTGISPVKV